MAERLGRPQEGRHPRFLTQVESEVCGIAQTRQIALKEGEVIFYDPPNRRAKVYTMEQKVKAVKKLEEYWTFERKWREERDAN